MSQQSGFFNAKVLEDGSYDRVYLAEDFANYFASFVGNGVFAKKLNGLQVLADSGMTLKVRSGQAWINGYWYENDSDLSLSLSTAPATGYRIDSVVLRYHDTSRSISCFVKPGDLNVNNPAPIRESGIYELVLAYVKVSAGSISISQSNIVDKRGDNSVCGFVTGAIDQIDTTEFYTQLNNWLESFISKTDEEYSDFTTYLNSQKNSANSSLTTFEGDLNALKATATTEINSLIEEIRGLLDGDVATNLQNQIDKKMNAPTSEIMMNQGGYIPSIGYKSDGTIDLPTVKYISVLNAGVGRLLARGRGGQGLSSIPYIETRSMFDGTNPFEHDKTNNSLSKNSQYLVPGTEYDGPDCLINAPTWERMMMLEKQNVRYLRAVSQLLMAGIPKFNDFKVIDPKGNSRLDIYFKKTKEDGREIFSGYGFQIFIFRSLQSQQFNYEDNFDIAVIDSQDIKAMFDDEEVSVSSTFGKMEGISYSKFSRLDSGPIVYIRGDSRVNPDEYTIAIKEYDATSDYDNASIGSWFDIGSQG